MKLKLSIITINYNDAKGLRRTMNSVFNQSFRDFQYIIIDGGSSDGSVDIIKEFENLKIKKIEDNSDQFDNSKQKSLVNDQVSFQWLSERDKGIYHAMNKGIARAKGEYCFFLNSGDYFVSTTVLESVFSENPTEDIVFGNLVVCLNENIVGKIVGKNLLTFLDL